MKDFPGYPVLIVDDEQDTLQGYRMALAGYSINNIELCQDSRKVMDLLARNRYILVLLDLMMPHLTGKDLLELIRARHPQIPVIVITGTENPQAAIDCQKFGIFDYMTKPVEISRLVSNIKRACELAELKAENSSLKERVVQDGLLKPEAFTPIITGNRKMLLLFKYLEAISASPQPLLLSGESGTGKELLARAAHRLFGEKTAFTAVNIAGLDDSLFSDTLFGHKKGAFTGADTDRKGLLTKAEGGILFLDEIGDLEMKSQIKLLRLLQEREYYPLGSDRPEYCNVKVIAATNRDLEKRMSDGLFRQDLYYRLSTHYIKIPPLRERLDDLPVLLRQFLNQGCHTLGVARMEVPNQVMELLSRYVFPGNIRELESMIFNALCVSLNGRLSLEALEEHVRRNQTGSHSLEDGMNLRNKAADTGIQGTTKTKILSITTSDGNLPTLKEMERFLIGNAMETACGNQSIAAPLLGISQPALSKRLLKIRLRSSGEKLESR